MIIMVKIENKINFSAVELESLLVNNFTTPTKKVITQTEIIVNAKYNKLSIIIDLISL